MRWWRCSSFHLRLRRILRLLELLGARATSQKADWRWPDALALWLNQLHVV
jgi:hypothetical protein